VQRFTPLLAEAAHPCRHAVGDRWWVDATYVKVAGTWLRLPRDRPVGQVIDVSTLKVELVYRTSFRTREEADLALFRFIDGLYNPHRLQRRLGWRSRHDEYEAAYWATPAGWPIPWRTPCPPGPRR
jgi:hypothetical protein